jgi:hypothetical protein
MRTDLLLFKPGNYWLGELPVAQEGEKSSMNPLKWRKMAWMINIDPDSTGEEVSGC